MKVMTHGFPLALRKRLEQAALERKYDLITGTIDPLAFAHSGRGILFFYLENPSDFNPDRFRSWKSNLPDFHCIAALATPEIRGVVRLFREGVDDLMIQPIDEKELECVFSRFPKPRTWLQAGKRAARRWARDLGHTLIHPVPGKESLGIAGMAYGEENFLFSCDLFVEFLGRFSLYSPIVTRGIQARGKKPEALLAYLMYQNRKRHHKDQLIDKFWPGSSPPSGRNSLHVAIHRIRKILERLCPGREALQFHNDFYLVNPDLIIDSDLRRFTHLWQVSQLVEEEQGLEVAIGAIQRGIPLYRGEFLENLRDEDWCLLERDNLLETYLHMCQKQADYLFNKRMYGACLAICRRMLEKDPCLEEIHRLMMICYQKMGQRDRAARQYRNCREILNAQLSIDPERATLELYREILSA